MNDELSALREEIRAGFAGMRQEFAAVRREMAEGLVAVRAEMGEEFAAVRREMAEGLAAVRAEMGEEFGAERREMAEGLAAVRAEMRHEFAGVHRRIDSTDERLRHTGLLLEHLRDDLRQLAEAHVLLDQRVERHRRENDAAHAEILALIRTSYAHMDRRVARLEERHPDR
jgi:hypothetical protein